MDPTDKENVAPPENGSNGSESSVDKTWDSEKYPAYQKSFPKKYWGHEAFNGINSMDEMLDRFVNPKKKAPEKYEGISEELSDVAEALRSADVAQDDAKKIADALGKHLPKKYSEESLKESYGADWEQADKDYTKAVEKIIESDKDRKAFNELKNNPVFFNFVRIVGKNLGDSPNLEIGKQVIHEERSKNPVKNILLKHMKN